MLSKWRFPKHSMITKGFKMYHKILDSFSSINVKSLIPKKIVMHSKLINRSFKITTNPRIDFGNK